MSVKAVKRCAKPESTPAGTPGEPAVVRPATLKALRKASSEDSGYLPPFRPMGTNSPPQTAPRQRPGQSST